MQEAEPVSIERLPIQNFMPPEGTEFRPSGYVTIPNQGASAVVVKFQIPKGYNAIINRLANSYVGAGFQEGQGLITWTLYIDYLNLVPAPNFQSFAASYGAVDNPAILNGIKAKQNNTVALVVSNANPGVIPAGQLIGGLFGGYYYPIALEPSTIAF